VSGEKLAGRLGGGDAIFLWALMVGLGGGWLKVCEGGEAETARGRREGRSC